MGIGEYNINVHLNAHFEIWSLHYTNKIKWFQHFDWNNPYAVSVYKSQCPYICRSVVSQKASKLEMQGRWQVTCDMGHYLFVCLSAHLMIFIVSYIRIFVTLCLQHCKHPAHSCVVGCKERGGLTCGESLNSSRNNNNAFVCCAGHS